MMKDTKRGLLTLAVLLAVFSVIAFVVPFHKNTAFWISYLCGVFAILFQLYIFKSSFDRAEAKSRFYGFPIARLGIIYLGVQLIVSIALIALAKYIPVWVVIIINTLILAFVLFGCVSAETVRNKVEEQDNQTINIREMRSLSLTIVNQCTDNNLKPTLQKLAEAFQFCDPISSEETKELESNLLTMLNDLQQAVKEGDTIAVEALCCKLTSKLTERNHICAVSK